MVIEKVHGLRATSMSLNDRFTLLATAAPDQALGIRQRRPSTGSIRNQNVNLNYKNRILMEQIARRLEQRQTLRQRIGIPGGLRRFGSESSLPGLVRANSFGSLNSGIKNRMSWRQSNGNLSRSASFGNLSASVWRGRSLRGFRRRGGGQRAVRGRFRGRANMGRVTRVSARGVAYKRPVRRFVTRGNVSGGARGNVRGGARGNVRGGVRGNTRGGARGNTGGGARGNTRGNPRGTMRGGARGRGRGQGVSRPQTPKPVPTKEELDAQLDQYMASSKSALDKELDEYMKNAMDFE